MDMVNIGTWKLTTDRDQFHKPHTQQAEAVACLPCLPADRSKRIYVHGDFDVCDPWLRGSITDAVAIGIVEHHACTQGLAGRY